jgi:hypothetical protein
MSSEHHLQTGVGLSNGQVTSARWRHLPLIPASGPFSRFVKALLTSKWQVLDKECLSVGFLAVCARVCACCSFKNFDFFNFRQMLEVYVFTVGTLSY